MYTDRYVAFLIGIFVALVIPVLAEAVILYQENFDSATEGQSITAPPLNWSAEYGDVRVGTANHPGWGKAVLGSLTPSYPWGRVNYFVTIPNNGVVTLTFDAWAYPRLPGQDSQHFEVALEFADGTRAASLSYGDNTTLEVGHWIFNADGIVGRPGQDKDYWLSSPKLWEEQTVRCTLVVDYNQHIVWGEFSDGSSTVKSDVFSFIGEPQLNNINIHEDTRWNTIGGDIDNIKLTWEAADLVLSLETSGKLTFNEVSNAVRYRVEWTSAPGGSWTNFTGAAGQWLDNIPATGSGVITASVPMWYRVVATLTSAPPQNNMVLIPAGKK